MQSILESVTKRINWEWHADHEYNSFIIRDIIEAVVHLQTDFVQIGDYTFLSVKVFVSGEFYVTTIVPIRRQSRQ